MWQRFAVCPLRTPLHCTSQAFVRTCRVLDPAALCREKLSLSCLLKLLVITSAFTPPLSVTYCLDTVIFLGLMSQVQCSNGVTCCLHMNLILCVVYQTLSDIYLFVENVHRAISLGQRLLQPPFNCFYLFCCFFFQHNVPNFSVIMSDFRKEKLNIIKQLKLQMCESRSFR